MVVGEKRLDPNSGDGIGGEILQDGEGGPCGRSDLPERKGRVLVPERGGISQM